MVLTFLGRLNCYLAGHDYSIRQSGGRMFLFCTTCGHRSGGIVLTGRSDATARDGRLRRPPLRGGDAHAYEQPSAQQ